MEYIGSTLIINGGEIITKSGNTAYGIYSSKSSSIITINGGIIGASSTGKSSYTIGTCGVYINSIQSFIIKHGTINANSSINGSYGIYSNTTNAVTIGDSEEELSTISPCIFGETYGVYLNNTSYNFNFNNGIIQSKNDDDITYNSQITPRQGYIPYTYYDYNYMKTCTILVQNVEHITFNQSPINWTNQNVRLTITYPVVEGADIQYSYDGQNWETTNKQVQVLDIEENQTIYARVIDQSGIIVDEAQHEITNIDKIIPEVGITPYTTRYEVNNDEDTANIEYTLTATDQGGSGLKNKKYGWSTSKEQEPNEWIEIQNGVEISKENTSIGTYYLWIDVEDNAGNKSEITKITYTVTKREPVAQIGETQYITIQQAIDEAKERADLGEENIVIEIIKDTDEECITYEDYEITLNLNGHTIGSSNKNTPIITNNGTLTIKDTNTQNPGIIEHLNGTAIKNNGTLTIGENDEDISIVLPKIYGKQIGIHTTEGIFNYYDGTITGETPIYKTATGLPEAHGPVGIEENGLTKVYLAVTSQYVARINYVYYTTLQQAIDACERKANNTKTTEIVIIKDIVLTETAKVDKGQNVTIDLNNHIIQSNTLNVIIDNYESLIITDESLEKKGEISNNRSGNTNVYVLRNLKAGTIELKAGTISCNLDSTYSLKYVCAINNNLTGTIKVTGGTIYSSSNGYHYIYGINNEENGTVIVNDGTITSENRYSTSACKCRGINNNSNGNVKITGGTVSGTGSDAGGVENNGTGTVKISGGTISAPGIGIYNKSTGLGEGIVEMSGGEILGRSYSIYNFGIFKISGGTIKVSKYGIYNNSSGTVEMNAGEITETNSSSSGSYGIYNYGTGPVTVRGGKIEFIGYNCQGIYNDSTGTIEISEVIINVTSSGIVNHGSGTIKIRGGKISSSSDSGIYNSTGTIAIGVKGDDIIDNNLKIKGERYGVYNDSGTVKLYDGIIQGTLKCFKGGINEIEENCQIKNETIEEYDSLYLEEASNDELIVLNTNTNVQYKSLTKAIDEIEENEETELKVLQSFILDKWIDIPEDKNVKLDLNGNTITTNFLSIYNHGDLEIKDSMNNGKIEFDVINNSGKLKISGGTISASENSSSIYGIYNIDSGTIEISGGIVNSRYMQNSSHQTTVIYSKSSGTIEISGGTVSSISSQGNNYGIYNIGSGRIEISGGTVSSISSQGTNYAIYNSDGTIEISGGTISSSNTYNNGGSCYGIYNGTGTIEINGGTVTSTANSANISTYGIYNHSTGTIEISGGTVNSSTLNRKSYGIYNYSTGTIIIGVSGDGLVSINNPEINSNGGSSYGITNTKGILYFYDGIINGNTKAIDGILSGIEENTELSDEITTAKELYLITELRNEAKIGQTEYETLQQAIDACSTSAGNTQTKIELLKSIYLSNNTLTIRNGQNILIDMSGYSINSSIDNITIENNGTLEIDNTSETTSKITTISNCSIKNNENKSLTIGNITIQNNKPGTQDDYNSIITNLGRINVTSATIYTEIQYIYPIYNDNDGIVKISGGAVTAKTSNVGYYPCYGIYNSSSGTIEISGGTVTANSGYNGSSICYGIYNNSTGTIIISGGTVSSRFYGIYNNTGIVRMIEGTIYGNSNVILNYGTGTVEITGGTVRSDGNGGSVRN